MVQNPWHSLHVLHHSTYVWYMSRRARQGVVTLGLPSISAERILHVQKLTCRVILPLNVTPPSPVAPLTAAPFSSAFAVVFVSSTNITVEVSLYFADRPRSWHSKTWRESHVPVGADPSAVKAVPFNQVDKAGLTLLHEHNPCEARLFSSPFVL